MSSLAEGRTLRPVAGGLLSALPEDAPPGAYDRHARLYDRLIGAPAYNRLIWGADVADYRAFASEAVGNGGEPLLDVGCGTAVFSAQAYASATRPLTLVDRSLGMLAVAARRIGTGAANVRFVQADLLDLPFAPGGFATVACHAVLHVFDDPWAALAALHAHVAPDGDLYVSMLVADRGFPSRPYLAMLHRRGEAGPPRTTAELSAAARALFGERAHVERRGAMAYLRAGGSARA
jgi:ubiquinone/menaquinone biosynthesis C-methylase UbiE